MKTIADITAVTILATVTITTTVTITICICIVDINLIINVMISPLSAVFLSPLKHSNNPLILLIITTEITVIIVTIISIFIYRRYYFRNNYYYYLCFCVGDIDRDGPATIGDPDMVNENMLFILSNTNVQFIHPTLD